MLFGIPVLCRSSRGDDAEKGNATLAACRQLTTIGEDGDGRKLSSRLSHLLHPCFRARQLTTPPASSSEEVEGSHRALLPSGATSSEALMPREKGGTTAASDLASCYVRRTEVKRRMRAVAELQKDVEHCFFVHVDGWIC